MSERFDTFGYGKAHEGAAPDPWEPATEAANVDDDAGLDPSTAAALLEQTTRQAQSRFDMRPPLLMLVGAVVVLVVYGAVWLSVRHQHPYKGPSGTSLAVLYSTLVIWVVLATTVIRRATRGIHGRSSRQRRAEGAAFATIWIAVYVFQGALLHAGASDAIVYGIYPAVAPLIIVGSAAAIHSAAHEHWSWMGFALAAVALGAIGAFAGPSGVWGVVGIGLCAILLVRVALQVRLRRA